MRVPCFVVLNAKQKEHHLGLGGSLKKNTRDTLDGPPPKKGTLDGEASSDGVQNKTRGPSLRRVLAGAAVLAAPHRPCAAQGGFGVPGSDAFFRVFFPAGTSPGKDNEPFDGLVMAEYRS